MLKRAAPASVLSATDSGDVGVHIMQDMFHSLMLSIASLLWHLQGNMAEREPDEVIIRKFRRLGRPDYMHTYTHAHVYLGI